MFSVWTSVQVKNPDHPRAGQAGTVYALPEDAGQVVVRFDADLALEAVAVADLVAL